MNETKPTMEELWDMVQVFSQHADNLKTLLVAERAKNKDLNIENSGWLETYRTSRSLRKLGVVELELP